MVAINKTAKAGILGGLLMGAVTLNATRPITNVNKVLNQNQTEVVSKEGAAGLQGVQQSTVPTVCNQRLVNTLVKFIENNEDREAINYLIDNVYKARGTFLGSALMQFEIDRRTLYHFMTGNTKLFKNSGINPELAKVIEGFGDRFYTTITPEKDGVTEWLYKKYTSVLMSNFQFDQNPPNGKEVIDRLDDIATKKTDFNFDERSEYFIYSNGYKDKVLKNRTDNQAMADLAAYKMFLIDKLMFKRELKGTGVLYGIGNFQNGKEDLADYFNKWIESVNPRTH